MYKWLFLYFSPGSFRGLEESSWAVGLLLKKTNKITMTLWSRKAICNDTELETGGNKEPTVQKGSGANDITLVDGGDNDNSREVQEGNGKNDPDIQKKIHQGTKTALIIVFPRHQFTSMVQYWQREQNTEAMNIE